MELPEEFKEYIKHKYFYDSKTIKNPSAFTSIYYIQGYEGRFGNVRAAIEDHIKYLTQRVVYETKTVKRKVTITEEVTIIKWKD